MSTELGPVLALDDAEIAGFLNRHWFISMMVSLGLIGVYGEIVEDETLNGWVLVYRPPDSAYYRYLWMHDRPSDYHDFIGSIVLGTGEGVAAAIDYTKWIVIAAVILLLVLQINKRLR